MSSLCVNCIQNKKQGSNRIRPVKKTEELRKKIGLTKNPENVKAYIICEICADELDIEPLKPPNEK